MELEMLNLSVELPKSLRGGVQTAYSMQNRESRAKRKSFKAISMISLSPRTHQPIGDRYDDSTAYQKLFLKNVQFDIAKQRTNLQFIYWVGGPTSKASASM